MTGADQNVTPEMPGTGDEAETYRTPRWLIGLVAVLGLAFLALLSVIVIKLMNGEGSMSAHKPAVVTAMADKDAVLKGKKLPVIDATGDFKVERPKGAKLVSSELHGREIMLHFRTPDGTDTLIVLNRMTGQESRVTIAP